MFKYLRFPLQSSARNFIRSYSENVSGGNKSTKIPFGPQVDVKYALEGWDEKMKKAGVEDREFNLKCIVSHVLNRKFSEVSDDYAHLRFSSEQLADFQRYCEARCARMPLQHIIGEWDFMDITLKTAPTVFIPRPETEEFVRLVIAKCKEYNIESILEVGCGSGAMSLSMLKALPKIKATAIDRSKAATKLAHENAQMLGLGDRFKVYNHTMEADKYVPEELSDQFFDVIISNPPYVKTDEFQYLHPEVVVYENLNALDGGPDGLRVARLVFDLASERLHPGGKLWLELGNDHPPMVKTIMHQKYQGRLDFVASYEDQYGRERFVELEKV